MHRTCLAAHVCGPTTEWAAGVVVVDGHRCADVRGRVLDAAAQGWPPISNQSPAAPVSPPLALLFRTPPDLLAPQRHPTIRPGCVERVRSWPQCRLAENDGVPWVPASNGPGTGSSAQAWDFDFLDVPTAVVLYE
ncbi:hypothetical protein B7494_g3280 [Chlorociboria aeruginascens]|nr:hypothetical protein B7494_g3280 [Chlorociboria aeruginascens]